MLYKPRPMDNTSSQRQQRSSQDTPDVNSTPQTTPCTMNSSKIAVVLAMLVGVALCSPCSDTCNAACGAAKTACDASVVLGPLCVAQFGVCSQGCAAICGCNDGCGAQCEPAFTDCTTNAHNMLQKGQCTVEKDVCVVNCEGLCAAQQANQAVAGAIAGVQGMLQPAA